MKFTATLLHPSSLALSLICFSLQSIASNQIPGPFDIPLKTPNNDSSTTNTHRELHNLRPRKMQDDFDFNDPASQPKEKIPFTAEEIHEARRLRKERIHEQRERAKKIIREHQPDVGRLERMAQEDIRRVYGNAVENDPLLEHEDNQWLRNLGNTQEYLADVSGEYDEWAQGYRMLGGFIDCDHNKDAGSGDHDDGNGKACSRWMMWAAYINPNYQGGGRSEYFSNNNYGYQGSYSSLDCHSPNTEWQLLGVYRQEFYQFIEQISKHLWAIDDYEYVVALAGLAYMTDDDCYGVGYDSNGNYVYAGVQPTYGGYFEMALYTDNACLILDTSGATFDDFGLTNDMDLGSKDDGTLTDDELYTLYGYWKDTQEYTLTQLNEVYSEFKYCTLCMDYPTYQDGYFIGDYGTDDDDLINQCWKFHSHDSFNCESSCIALGDAQGTITKINYLGNSYGQSWDGSSGGSGGGSSSGGHNSSGGGSGGYKASSASKFAKFKANAFLTFNGVLFIATFLAFSVARGNREGVDAPDKKRSLLSKEERRAAKSPRSSSSKKSSKSKSSSSKSKKSTRSLGSRTSRKSSSSRPKSRQRSSSRTRMGGTYA